MKILCVLGSPRKNSNSTAVAMRLLEGAKENGHEVKIYKLNDMNVRGCQGCGYCKERPSDCIVNDDLLSYWKEFHECGAMIVTAPNYSNYPCGPLITFTNRHYCISTKDWKPRVEPGKKLVGIFSQARPDREVFMPAYKWLLKDYQNQGMVLVDTIVHTREDSLDADSDIMTRAYNVGKFL